MKIWNRIPLAVAALCAVAAFSSCESISQKLNPGAVQAATLDRSIVTTWTEDLHPDALVGVEFERSSDSIDNTGMTTALGQIDRFNAIMLNGRAQSGTAARFRTTVREWCLKGIEGRIHRGEYGNESKPFLLQAIDDFEQALQVAEGVSTLPEAEEWVTPWDHVGQARFRHRLDTQWNDLKREELKKMRAMPEGPDRKDEAMILALEYVAYMSRETQAR